MEISFRDNGVGTLKTFHKTTIFDLKIAWRVFERRNWGLRKDVFSALRMRIWIILGFLMVT